MYITITISPTFVDFVEAVRCRPGAVGRDKRTVEIISGRDRRLQGQAPEETGSRLQRDRSGVSEMEPLPATQDALRLELRPAGSLEVRHLLSLLILREFPFTVDPAVVVVVLVFGFLADV